MSGENRNSYGLFLRGRTAGMIGQVAVLLARLHLRHVLAGFLLRGQFSLDGLGCVHRHGHAV